MVDPESMSYRVNTDSPQYRITIPEVITHLRICVPEDLFLETSTHAECDVIVSVKVDLAESDILGMLLILLLTKSIECGNHKDFRNYQKRIGN